MKILEVVHRYPPATGGSEKVVYELSKNFAKMGHEVTVVTSMSTGNNDTRGFSTGRGFSLKNNFNKDLVEQETSEKVTIHRFPPIFQFGPYAFNPKMKKWIIKNIKKYDVVHVHGYQTYEAQIVSKIASKNNIPYVHTAHDIIAHYGGLLGFFKKIFDKIYGKTILNNSTKLIALTPENVKQFNNIIPCNDKIITIPNGIDEPKKVKTEELEKLRVKLGNPEKIILYVGRIVKYKGCQHIIDAMKGILKDYPTAKALFVGEDQGYKNELELMAQSLGISNSCIFTGRVQDTTPYFKIADVFIFPSTGEGFGLSPVEAMSHGIPCILANEGGLMYVLKDVGGVPIIMNGDVGTQIETAALTILKGGKDLEKQKTKFMKNTEKYRWPDISKRTLKVLKDAVNENKNEKNN